MFKMLWMQQHQEEYPCTYVHKGNIADLKCFDLLRLLVIDLLYSTVNLDALETMFHIDSFNVG